MSDLQAGILAAAALVAALATLWKFLVLPGHLMAKRVHHFLDDWFGEEARPGREATPAMPDRITALEKGYAEMTALADEVKGWMEESTTDRRTIRLRLDTVAAIVESTTSDEDEPEQDAPQ